ncbi:MurR/RpiR family transcriptional regulator [Aestuariibacter halophilus]|uniref:MurR/RpiR family transcriptional regulator n=1 Tax=Fluctibacter halophilus TaxID=226011 RepID=A0ABS8G7C2_9ALTE|nr:MurR/RpiR family transcriptional regulator [Aestuariibacter halophilus]MCC2615720.1 MurR/RpiR family transcriptional regulator [Aestuariibacter halophilus]
MSKTIPFVARIEQQYENLSPNARKVANVLQQNPLAVLQTSVEEIAEVSQTSKATVSRFFRQLGYESHLDVKRELRQLRDSGYPLAITPTQGDFVEDELIKIRQTLENINKEDVEMLVQRILSAPRITLIGFRNSYPIALHFRQQLLQIRDKVRLLPQPGQTLGEELQDTHSDELVIVIGFRRRPRVMPHLIEQLQQHQVVMIGDPSALIYKSKVTQLLICQLGQELPLDSYAAPMSLISMVCNEVLNQRPTANSRIKAISRLYSEMEELEAQ